MPISIRPDVSGSVGGQETNRYLLVIFGVVLPLAAVAETSERNRSAEMDEVFHFCRNEALANRAMMTAIVRAGKTLNGLCEWIASGLVGAMPSDIVAAGQQGHLVSLDLFGWSG